MPKAQVTAPTVTTNPVAAPIEPGRCAGGSSSGRGRSTLVLTTALPFAGAGWRSRGSRRWAARAPLLLQLPAYNVMGRMTIATAPTPRPTPPRELGPGGPPRPTQRDVQKKPPISRRGYDEDEVDAFLDLVEAELARLTGRPCQLEACPGAAWLAAPRPRRTGGQHHDQAERPKASEPTPTPPPARDVLAADRPQPAGDPRRWVAECRAALRRAS
jgi:DivIVA domain-containing protein